MTMSMKTQARSNELGLSENAADCESACFTTAALAVPASMHIYLNK
jgi:hypothetical protein